MALLKYFAASAAPKGSSDKEENWLATSRSTITWVADMSNFVISKNPENVDHYKGIAIFAIRTLFHENLTLDTDTAASYTLIAKRFGGMPCLAELRDTRASLTPK